MDPSLDLQIAVRRRLIASSALVALVPADSIFDRNTRPEALPSIMIGESQTVPDDGLARDRHRVSLTLHTWTDGPGTESVKRIAGVIRNALADGPVSLDHHHVADLLIAETNVVRDPSGISHGVMTLQARLQELA